MSSANAADKALLDVYYEAGPSHSSIRTPILKGFRQLSVKWVRVGVNWGQREAEQNSYAAAEVARLDDLVNELSLTGIKVLLGVNCLPTWAQDRSYSGNSGTAYPIRADALDDFGRLGKFLAAHVGDGVRDIECWNGPNLWTCLYQRTAKDDYFAPARTCACSRHFTPVFNEATQRYASSPAPPRPSA